MIYAQLKRIILSIMKVDILEIFFEDIESEFVFFVGLVIFIILRYVFLICNLRWIDHTIKTLEQLFHFQF